MNVALTNYGLRYFLEHCQKDQVANHATSAWLREFGVGVLAPYRDQEAHNQLLAQGLIEKIPGSQSQDDVTLRHLRNPLENVERVILEFTTRCNFNCHHCYNTKVERVTEQDIDLLKSAVDVFARIGIRQFDFIGGEVSKYGDGWLQVVQHIHSYHDTTVKLLTNGWWLGQTDFVAAGQRYANAESYLAHLKECGLSHVVFSLDGQGAVHDHSRGRAGLYDCIMEGFELVRAAGLEPRVSLLIRNDVDGEQFATFLADLADRIYYFTPADTLLTKVQKLTADRTNVLSNFIDIGSGARHGVIRAKPLDIPESILYCKGFFRPAPHLTIKANGELATCRITNAGEGYGNLHERDLVQILNRMQDQFVFQLHAQRRIGDYRRFVNTDLFDSFSHVCSLRAVLTLIARFMEEQGVDPEDEGAILRINQEVARYTGHL